MQFLQDNVVALFKAYGWRVALTVIVVLALVATGIVWVLRIDLAGLLP